jgi:hypothetical protein
MNQRGLEGEDLEDMVTSTPPLIYLRGLQLPPIGMRLYCRARRNAYSSVSRDMNDAAEPFPRIGGEKR